MLIDASPDEPEKHLHRSAEQEDREEIADAVGGIAAALGDHIGKNRESDAPDDAQNAILREQYEPDMIDGHRDEGDQLKGVGGEPGRHFQIHGMILAGMIRGV